jgi:hypothetical protein
VAGESTPNQPAIATPAFDRLCPYQLNYSLDFCGGVMESIIVNAANMFIYSLTGIGLRGTTYQATLARRAVRALKQEVAQNDIFFSKLLKNNPGLHRNYGENSVIYLNDFFKKIYQASH